MASIPVQTSDVVNAILGVDDDSSIARLRNQKPDLVRELQDYYLSLFEPTAASAQALPVVDRALVAIRVASHKGSTAVSDWYRRLALGAGATAAQLDLAADMSRPVEDATKLGAVLRHADLLTTRPDDAQKSDLQALKDTGFTPAGIVSLSQTIAFVSYQLRFVAGLRAFGDR